MAGALDNGRFRIELCSDDNDGLECNDRVDMCMRCSDVWEVGTVHACCPCDPEGPAIGCASCCDSRCDKVWGLDDGGGGSSKGTIGEFGRGD